MKPKRLLRMVIYENPWVNLYADKVQFPDGRIIDKHHILDFEKEAVAVLVENVQGQILLIRAYRYPTDTIEWEIPSGSIEKGESILVAGRREVQEDSGYETTDDEFLYTYYLYWLLFLSAGYYCVTGVDSTMVWVYSGLSNAN